MPLIDFLPAHRIRDWIEPRLVDIDSYGSRGEGVWANWERTYEKRTDEE